MNITDVRIRKLTDVGKMKAIVSVTFDDAIVIHDIKIIQGNDSLFIAMPSRRLPNGEFRDVAHPINAEARAEIERIVFEKYKELENEEGQEVAEEE
ncbi:stage V sporulation protein G [Peptoniphilus koenoeneniae]|uniref:Putative septation protein SpoVG n=1 Tax=Peptoniphilus koenoeneniae TaxID=507751 RepID=A0ABU0AUD8_9FIRM|nr:MULTISPECIES: septation regulator SpoVG [Peptoniphilus]ERT57268.1 putative negative regulator of asymmetric septation [Peptoniphilus sp. BV3C26]MDQ0274871.1 stage V sporulation protein G [Peptoniphilus koenoeneniae]